MNTALLPRTTVAPPINFLFHRAQTTIDELSAFIPLAGDLQREAVRYQLRISGPMHWHYVGFFGDPKQSFTLEVAVPIDSIPADYDGSMQVKRTEPFKCVSLVHEGEWQRLPESYAKVMAFVQEHGLRPTGNNRELYVNADFKNPSANITEIQLGIE